jgi:hypothetical protein
MIALQMRKINFLARECLRRAAGLRQVHIVGCSRSGTTMAQHAMVAFDRAVVAEGETPVRYPFASDIVHYMRMCGGRLSHHTLFTKRAFRWFEEENRRVLEDRVRSETMGLILLVRDPRDVLCSRHSGAAQDQAYVTPEHWYASIRAGDRLFENLRDHEPKVVVRYEDFVLHPEQVAESLMRRFDLELRPGVTSIAALKRNRTLYPYPLSDDAAMAMHGLRDAAPSSIGRWRTMSFDYRQHVADRTIREHIAQFIIRHGYDNDGAPSSLIAIA